MTYQTFFKKSLMPLLVIHALVSVVAAGFFLWDGIWRPLWPSVLMLSFSFLIFPFLLFPTALFAGLMQVLETSHPKVSKIMMGLSLGYMAMVMVLVGLGSFFLVEPYFEFDTTKWVAYFWGASSTVTIWAFFAMRDRENVLFITLIWILQLAIYIAGYIEFVKGDGFLSPFFWIAFGVMVVGMALQNLLENKFIAKKPVA